MPTGPPQAITLGCPAVPQLAAAKHSAQGALDAMRAASDDALLGPEGFRFVIDCKFDGERQQIHYQGVEAPCQYWSRRGVDHASATGSGYSVFDPVLKAQVTSSSCILDGEIVVFNKARCEGRVVAG